MYADGLVNKPATIRSKYIPRDLPKQILKTFK
jgi:hypothetical protein